MCLLKPFFHCLYGETLQSYLCTVGCLGGQRCLHQLANFVHFYRYVCNSGQRYSHLCANFVHSHDYVCISGQSCSHLFANFVHPHEYVCISGQRCIFVLPKSGQRCIFVLWQSGQRCVFVLSQSGTLGTEMLKVFLCGRSKVCDCKHSEPYHT